MPLSLVGTFGAMYALGYSLDNLSLMALTISTGFVVDDAIVMIENISRYLEAGEPPLEAALKGAEQIGFTIVSLTVSLIAVLIPLLFMGDVVGRLFREFAVTLAVTIVVSAVVSLTLTPMMCARILRHAPARPSRAGSTAWSERVFERMIAFYGRTLKVVLRHQHAHAARRARRRWSLTIALYILIPKGFFPVAGHRRHPGHLAGAARRSRSRRWPSASRQLARVILRDPAVESLSSFIGVDGTNTTLNSGRFSINLKPLRSASSSAADVIRRLQPRARARGRGHHAVHAAGPEHHGRRPREPHAVPVHARGSGRRRARRVDGEVRRPAQDAAGADRRRDRPADRRPRGVRRRSIA